MRVRRGAIALAMLLMASATPLAGQAGAGEENLRAAMRLLLPGQPGLPGAEARSRCLTLPADPPRDRLEGPFGDSLQATRCEVVSFDTLGAAPGGPYHAATYRWSSIYSAEDTSRGATARDTVVETEVVLFAAAEPGRVRPLWHQRIEAGPYAVWRSLSGAIAAPDGATALFAVTYCLNGTGGCGQEFYRRTPAGAWGPVRQVWLRALPASHAAGIRHGVSIDPGTLVAEAGFYGDDDPNCCPSQLLRAELALAGDSLLLRRHEVVPYPAE